MITSIIPYVREAVHGGHGSADRVLREVRRRLSPDDVRNLLPSGKEESLRSVEAALRYLSTRGEIVLVRIGDGFAWRPTLAGEDVS